MATRPDDTARGIDPRERVEQVDSFLGLRNTIGESSFARGDLSVALNCDIDDALNILRRTGHSAPVTVAIDRDLWAGGSVCLGVGSNALKLMQPDYSTTTLRTGLTPGRPLAYTQVGDRTFYANGVELGCVQGGAHRTWGLAVPGTPVATAAGGTLRAGTYQYAVTYVRSGGQESGAGRAGRITLATTGGIALSAIPVSSDPTVAAKIVYVSAVDGEALFSSGVLGAADTTFTIDEVRAGASPLLTQFLQPPPAGDFIGAWRGWMLVAKDDRLYPSEPYAPELFDWRRAYPFGARITMVAPVRDGVWIGTESQIAWLTGESPEKWSYRVVANYGAVPGALTFADSELIGNGSERGDVTAFFGTTRGLCVGTAAGAFMNMTQERFSYPIQQRGAALVRRHRGTAQFLASFRGAEVVGNVAT